MAYNYNIAIEKAADRVKEALSRGGWIAIKHRYKPEDVDSGEVTRCEKYRAAYGQDQHHDCTICYGTTFTGGFHPTVVKDGVVTDVSKRVKKDGKGWVTIVQPTLTIEPYEDLQTSDLIAIVEWDGSRVVRVAERYEIKTVTPIRLAVNGYEQFSRPDAEIGMTAVLTLLPEDHIFYQVDI